MHYRRWQRHGDPLANPFVPAKPKTPKKKPLTTLERFWQKVDKDHPSGCWTWTGALNDSGYGVFFANYEFTGKRFEYAHRVSFWLSGKHLMDDEVVDHSCKRGSKGCVTPEHLSPLHRLKNCGQGGAKLRKYWCDKHNCERIYNPKRKQSRCPVCNREAVKKWRRKHKI